MTLVLRYSARSDRGLVRQNNQDSVYAGPRLLALADGMGGHAAGEVASKLVISALVPLDDDEPGDDLLRELRDATHEGNRAITQLVNEQPDLEGMGTTLTAILFAGSRLGMVHVGDSRAYLMRDGHFSQITKDDTFVQSLVDEGRITEDEVHTHPQRSLLLRALTGHELEPSLTIREARAGDRYLLCSDGLSGVVSAETLADTLRNPDPKLTADRLIELALRGGGPDNITVIVADVVDIDFGEDDPIVGGAAGDGSDSDMAPPDSAAARASVTTLPRVAPQRIEPRAETPPPRRKGKAALIVLSVLIVLVGATALARLWVMQQYYVGTKADAVVIYQGVRGSVLGIPLQTLRERSCQPNERDCTEINVADLTESARQTVQAGIIPKQSGLEGARDTVRRLREDEMLPPCPTEPPAAPKPNPTPGAAGKPADAGQPPADPDTTDLQPRRPEPGKTCRTVS
ncbi:PP2C family protein-serine/threonine phosphatase [Pseudonocardia spinosispora]|uniref:PP2C family protein-serine/threonine phosphatase n=1 Tax=Pseudonocardia spinosispora TaxID=103441 RepID=UPI0004141BCC|nr:PP2C family serine/threonine-protein phosphatase [Pseudonocardia spinosispora]